MHHIMLAEMCSNRSILRESLATRKRLTTFHGSFLRGAQPFRHEPLQHAAQHKVNRQAYLEMLTTAGIPPKECQSSLQVVNRQTRKVSAQKGAVAPAPTPAPVPKKQKQEGNELSWQPGTSHRKSLAELSCR